MKDFQLRLASAPILVVDDVAANVVLLENLLRQRGYQQVVTTSDPLQVAPLHQQHNFALILLDMQMPRLDGLGRRSCEFDVVASFGSPATWPRGEAPDCKSGHSGSTPLVAFSLRR